MESIIETLICWMCRKPDPDHTLAIKDEQGKIKKHVLVHMQCLGDQYFKYKHVNIRN